MVKGFNSKAQIGCSICCMLSLFMALIATILIHVAFNALIEPLVKLPENLLTGINDVLHFATLKTDAASVAAQAQATLQKCGVNVGQCPSPPSSNRTSNTAAELAGIQAIFKSTLASVEKTANDKYLGIGDFQKAGADLKAIHAKMDEAAKIQQPTPCDVTDPLYCSIYTASIAAQSAAAQVQQGVDKITNSKEVKEFKNQTKNVKTGLNVLPYLFWLSTLFYVCFFFSKRPSCRGGAAPCCACTWHTIFFIVSIIICIAIVSVGIAVVAVARDVKIKEPFKGEPTITQLVDHIEIQFPKFYNVVFKDFIGGLKKTFDAWVVFLVAHIVMAFHACSCCCGLYIETPKASS